MNNNTNFDLQLFIDKGNRCKRLLNLTEFTPNSDNCFVSSFKDKLSKDDKNMDLLYRSLTTLGQTSLIIAPTGSGKTFAIQSLSKRLYKKSKEKEIVILLCPNKIQNLQNEMSYQMVCLIKGSKDFMSYNLNANELTFSAVYDKISNILEHMDLILKQDIHLHLVIDEAHLLVEQNNFRNECINNLVKAMNVVKANHGNVLLLTATPDSLLTMQYDHIIHFVPEQGYKANCNKIVLYKNKTKSNMGNFTYQCIKDETTLVFLRYNSLDTIEKLKNDLIFKKEKNVLTLDGRQKGFQKVGSKIQCKNVLFDHIVNQDELPATYQKRPVDAYITTSVLEVGTNIHSIGGKQNKKLRPIYVIQDKNQMSLNAMMQFFNRPRFPVEEYRIFMPFIPEIKDIPFQSLENIIKAQLQKVETYRNSFQKTMEAIALRETNQKYIIHQMKQTLHSKDLENRSNCLDCIYLKQDGTTLSIEVDSFAFFQQCYNQYIQQYFYKQDRLVQKLEELFQVPVEVIEVEDTDGPDDSDKEQIKQTLTKLMEQPSLQAEVIENQIVSDCLLAIQASHTFYLLKNLFDYYNQIYDSKEEALQKACAILLTDKTILYKKEIRNTIITMFQQFRGFELRSFEQFLMGVLNIDTISPKLAHQFYLMKADNRCLQLFQTLLKLNCSFLSFQKEIRGLDSFLLVQQKLNEKQHVFYNRLYQENATYLPGKAGLEQKLILDQFYTFNESGNLVQRTLTLSLLTELQTLFKEVFHQMYGIKKIIKLIASCFTVVTVKNQKRIYALK